MDQKISELKKQLISVIREKSYQEGDFTLASGQKSKFYVDLKNTTLDPEGAYLIGRLIAEIVSEKNLTVDGVGGLTLGADPIATAVSLVARENGKKWPAYIVRKEPKKHGTSKFIEGAGALKPGGSLLVLEDVVTTGGSSQKAIERVREEGFQVSAVFTVVDRNQGGAETFGKLGVPYYWLCTLDEIQSS